MKRSLRSPDGSVETYEYDTVGQLTKQLDKANDGTVINSYEYTYNLAGNITSINKNRKSKGRIDKNQASGNASSNNQATGTNSSDIQTSSKVTMEYSSDNRLIRYNGKTVSYDAEGNMTYGPLNGQM